MLRMKFSSAFLNAALNIGILGQAGAGPSKIRAC